MNSYLLDLPAAVSFSGGLTSGYMSWHIADAFRREQGALPADLRFVFCNTGKEREETLQFVERCSLEWDLPVTWLEYRNQELPEAEQTRRSRWCHSFDEVNYATASRNGEPFEAAIRARGFLPNPVTRFCTAELKIRTTYRYLRSLGWTDWTNALGLRADEPHRVHPARNPPAQSRQRGEEVACPLYDAGVSLPAIRAWWAAQPFTLALEPWEGNCDLCFLKGRGSIQRVLRERPDLGEWWAQMETVVVNRKSSGTERFRLDRPTYAQLLALVQEQPEFDFGDAPEAGGVSCFCTD